MKKILAMVVMAVVAVVVIGAAALLSYRLTIANQERRIADTGTLSNGQNPSGTGNTNNPANPATQSEPDINVLLLGLDENNLPDVMFYLHFSWETKQINIVNIPRDSRVQVTQKQREAFAEIGRSGWITPSGEFILNELFTRAGGRQRDGHGIRFMKEHLEPLLGVEFDYHVIMNLRGFRDIVNAVDGVYMYVPFKLYYRGIQREDGTWSSGTIDIDIDYGYQRLNGEQAEQVVRFRHNIGDIARIDLQQRFMQAFMEQVLSLHAVLSNPVAFASTLINHVDTNIGLPKVIEYNNKGILQAVNADNVHYHLIPGEMRGRYYNIDEDASKLLVRDIKRGIIKGDE